MVVFIQSAVETRPVEPRTQIISGSVDSLIDFGRKAHKTWLAHI